MNPTGRRALFGATAALFLSADAVAAPTAAPEEPPGYRTSHYHAPTPRTLRGATVLTTAQAVDLWRTKAAVFVDVLPRPPRPAGLAPGTIWHEPAHQNIPGSVWLPDTGYGVLTAAALAYFQQGLAAVTGGDRQRPIVFYCKPDCWMSWNAAKRALSLGYKHVAWYPSGTAGWRAAGLPLQRCEPRPRPG